MVKHSADNRKSEVQLFHRGPFQKMGNPDGLDGWFATIQGRIVTVILHQKMQVQFNGLEYGAFNLGMASSILPTCTRKNIGASDNGSPTGFGPVSRGSNPFAPSIGNRKSFGYVSETVNFVLRGVVRVHRFPPDLKDCDVAQRQSRELLTPRSQVRSLPSQPETK